MTHTSHLIATTSDPIMPREFRVASISMLTRGEMPYSLSRILPNVPLNDSHLAKRFLRYAADSIQTQSFLWQDSGIDADSIADRLRRVPLKAACAVYESLLLTSKATWDHLMVICGDDNQEIKTIT